MAVNNEIYGELGDRWYAAQDDPVALLRAESRLRTGWILDLLQSHNPAPLAILDVGCGGGFLTNPLAAAGHRVTGLDLAQGAMAVARRHDATGQVRFLAADARRLPFRDGAFQVVCAMDFLEHLSERSVFLAEAARVLRPGGLFLFHTFNRNPLCHLVAIKGVEWVVRNTPKDMHVIELFMKPRELEDLCACHGLQVQVLRGTRPRLLSRSFLKLLCTGRVDDGFQFLFTRSLLMGYCGYARKRP
jgi:2-polyprenyl-6-hydroxyphenyl methylase/3-demethylubiquinone-9 3-methyltransferase